MRMRSAARLNGGYLPGLADIGDVEDADAAEPFGTDWRCHSLGAAIDTAACLLDRHDEQVAVNRDVALTAGAHHRRNQTRLPGVLDVVAVETVEVSHDEVITLERQVGVREAET